MWRDRDEEAMRHSDFDLSSSPRSNPSPRASPSRPKSPGRGRKGGERQKLTDETEVKPSEDSQTVRQYMIWTTGILAFLFVFISVIFLLSSASASGSPELRGQVRASAAKQKEMPVDPPPRPSSTEAEKTDSDIDPTSATADASIQPPAAVPPASAKEEAENSDSLPFPFSPSPSARVYEKRLMKLDPMKPKKGENLVFFGPFVYDEPRLVTSILPVVNMTYVHHLVVYKSLSTDSEAKYHSFSRLSPVGEVFAWARTGNDVALPFAFPHGLGLFVGPGTDALSLILNIHFEVPEAVVQNNELVTAAIEVSAVPLDPKIPVGWRGYAEALRDAHQGPSPHRHHKKHSTRPLEALEFAVGEIAPPPPAGLEPPPLAGIAIQMLLNYTFRLPPGKEMTEATDTCVLSRDVSIFAYRNHGHEIGRRWRTHVFRDGLDTGPVLDRSVQEPQIFNQINEGAAKGVQLRAGDMIQLHCEYDTRERNFTTTVGADLSKGEEMCNQYLMFHPHFPSTPETVKEWGYVPVCLSVDSKDVPPPRDFVPFALPASAGGGAWEIVGLPPAESLGQVSAVAASVDGAWLFVLARRANEFDSMGVIDEDTVFKIDAHTNRVVGSFGAGLFVTPHGLTCDSKGDVWVADSGQNVVVKLSGQTGEVVLRLGEAGRRGEGELFSAPTDVAEDSETGEVFISDGYGNSRVAVFDGRTGRFLREWGGRRGTKEGEFNIVHGVAFDTHRRQVFVADRENGRIQVFRTDGELVAVWPSEFVTPSARMNRERPWPAHLSAVAYSGFFDLLFSIEGSTVVTRRPDSGTVVKSWEWLKEDGWPHDIDLGVNAKEPVLMVAELDSKQVRQFQLDLSWLGYR
uniref:peptidylamidoglycolate lyase n=1 Tax=Chromera velia CCMP2878 TaxID=1169474 RepID=A0A0G4FN76_9ALVE|eukprot:Cvel_3544.t1-p1 / transcript=Cvel_3544.t1 / gene=Cvel_3544 / organism=Chromera_velia_CCMP2878 / gene_product=Peptidyl-glycine alpha-amidating monooxygenase B, putative / transcript_product=Peptidyl-glycine alpha-amidating monooxygenase B, putative / location=Cvel_scaffold144:98272-101362(-) / protein_length=855 / sequence_SO=supercontig / SO=protein_coding / is_pseudo=false